MLFVLVLPPTVEAACGPSPPAVNTSGALWTDEDGPGAAYTTSALDSCTWIVNCTPTNNRTYLTITLDFAGNGFGVAVYDGSGGLLDKINPDIFSSSNSYIALASVSVSSPFTIVSSSGIFLPSPFNGAAVHFTCYREVDPQLVQVDLRSRETRTVTLSLDNYTQDPFNGTVPVFPHLQYNARLKKAQGYGPWTSMSYYNYKWSEPTWSDSVTSWLVLDLVGYGAGKFIRVTFNCTPHQFLACANRHPQPALQYDRVDTFAMQSRETGIVYRYASTSRGDSNGEPTPVHNVCPLHAYCVESDHELVITYLGLAKQPYWSFSMTNPDGSTRSNLPQGRTVVVGSEFSSLNKRLSGTSALESQPDAVYPRGWDLFNYRAGFDIYMECRRREPVDLRPSVDLVAVAAKDAYGLASTRDVTLEQWASVQPTGYQSQFRLYPYNDTDLAIHNQAQINYAGAKAKGQQAPLLLGPFSHGDVHPVVVPVTCGLFSNVMISLEDIQNYTWVDVFELPLRSGFLDRGNSTNLRFVSANRRSDTDAQPWGYSYSSRFPDVVSYLLESPAEIQWSGVRLPVSLDIPSVKITALCTLHGRNGPLPTYRWPFNTTLFLSAVAQPSNFLKPMKESEGRIDAVSSDADGGLGAFATTGNVVANILCPRRFQQCTIVIKQIYASLDPTQQSLTITAANGTTLLSAQAARPIQTAGRFVDAGLYAFNGATITLTSMTPSVSSNGFTITYAMDSTESIMSAATPTVSRSRSYVLTASQAITATPVVSLTRSLRLSATASKIIAPRYGGAPTRVATTRQCSHEPTPSPTTAFHIRVELTERRTHTASSSPPPPPPPPLSDVRQGTLQGFGLGLNPTVVTAVVSTGYGSTAVAAALSPTSGNKASATSRLVSVGVCAVIADVGWPDDWSLMPGIAAGNSGGVSNADGDSGASSAAARVLSTIVLISAVWVANAVWLARGGSTLEEPMITP